MNNNNYNVWHKVKVYGFRVAYGLDAGDGGAGESAVNELAPHGATQGTDYWTTAGRVPTAVARAEASAIVSLAGGTADAVSQEISVGTHAPAMVITVR